MIVAAETARTVYALKPLEDSRWEGFVERHPQSSIFHTSGWLEALRRTYGHQPCALTMSPPGVPLDNAWVYCAIDSWLTGRRLVSLPFSDHCQPLTSPEASQEQLFSAVVTILRRDRLRYFEARPLQSVADSVAVLASELLTSTHIYCLHQIDLAPDLQTLFRNCHKSSTQRKIHRAKRERLGYEEGRSDALLDAFYDLQVLTRRRHCVPPQPKSWFRNVADCLGEAVKIRVAYKGKQAIAAIITIRHKDVIVYKYGASNASHHNLGGIHLLLWKTIEEAKLAALRAVEMGRSNVEDKGLITFKDRWGSSRSTLYYSRFTSATFPKDACSHLDNWARRVTLNLFRYVPDSLARAAGEQLYKHIG